MPSTEPLILAFDTSAAHCAAALLSGEQVLAERIEPMARGQAERLIPLLQETMDAAKADWSDLSALGVGIGPGNFTGIRISVAAARGLALGLGVPAYGVTSLDAALEGTKDAIPCVSAPRGQAYAQPIGTSEAGLYAPQDLPPGPLVGPATEALGQALGRDAKQSVYQVSVAIARIALRKMQAGETAAAVPYYIKPADAAPPRDTPPRIIEDD